MDTHIHKHIIGQNGEMLKKLKQQTTSITVPHISDNSTDVTITGIWHGIEAAQYDIQNITDMCDFSSHQILCIPKQYHPFISGSNNQNRSDIEKQSGAHIRIPPHCLLKNEILVFGDEDEVATAVNAIFEKYESRIHRCRSLFVQLCISQKKMLLGPTGNNVAEKLACMGVHLELSNNTVLLYGEKGDVTEALAMMQECVKEISMCTIGVPAKFHKFIIGPKGSTLNSLISQHPNVHVDFYEKQDSIMLTGFPSDIMCVKTVLLDKYRESHKEKSVLHES